MYEICTVMIMLLQRNNRAMRVVVVVHRRDDLRVQLLYTRIPRIYHTISVHIHTVSCYM